MHKNPFYLNVLPIEAPFCGREEELRVLTQRALEGKSVVIISPRRYGKTSLIKRVQHGLQQQSVTSIYVDVSGAPKVDDFARRLSQGLYALLAKQNTWFEQAKKIITSWRPVMATDPYTGEVSVSVQPVSQRTGVSLLEETMASLDAFLASLPDERFHIAIDEFQDIADFGENSSYAVEALLRRYIQHQSNCSYFFLGSRRRVLQDMFNQKSRPFWHSAINMVLPALPRDAASEFLVRQFTLGGKTCPPTIAERIVDITICYPYYVQRLAYAIFEVAPGEDILDAHFNQGLGKMLAEEAATFGVMERSLAAGQRNFLRALALEPNKTPLAHTYIQRHKLGSRTALENALNKLELLDYVEKGNDEVFRLTDPVFALWLNKDRMPLETPEIVAGEQAAAPKLVSLAEERTRTGFVEPGTAEINGYRSDELIEPMARILTPGSESKASEPEKPEIRLFLSYAHANNKRKQQLCKLLEARLRRSKKYRFNVWEDRNVLVGEDWHSRIQGSIADCHFGLLLLSSEFLASEYITQKELPPLMDRCLPVALEAISLTGEDLKGLDAKQIFFYNTKAFGECKQPNTRRFIQEFVAQIEARAEALPATATEPWLESKDECAMLAMHLHDKGAMITGRQLARFGERYRAQDHCELKVDIGQGEPALAYLETWLTEPNSPPYFALLGDYGAGKTFTCRMLARRINAKRKEDPAAYPFCIYIDLRTVDTRVGAEKRIPGLRDILQDAITKTRDPLEHDGATPDDIIRLVRQHGAAILYDGLDEKTVHFTPEEANQFLSELLKIRDPGAPGESASQGKILISCRSHYFKDTVEQNALFLARDREGRHRDSYRSCTLLPFDGPQIRQYVQQRLGCDANEVERIADLLASVHNLGDLATRPYLLSLLTEFIPDLEEGRIRNPAGLYSQATQRWLARDDGKHEWSTAHKELLMQSLALAIHQGGGVPLPADRLEAWLDQWLHDHPAIGSAYRNMNRETLKKDLRTATFLVRIGDQDFGFAHTSLQEFFLARYLAAAVVDNNPDAWAIARPSTETMQFVAELLELEEETLTKQGRGGSLAATLNTWRTVYRPLASELLFRYGLGVRDKLARAQGKTTGSVPAPVFAGWDLHGADLREVRVVGAEGERLNMAGSIFSGADLRRAEFRAVRLDGCDFGGARLNNARFLNCTATKAGFADADLTGAIFRNADEPYPGLWMACDFTTPHHYRTGWLAPGRWLAAYPNSRFSEDIPQAKAGSCFPPVPGMAGGRKKLFWKRGHSGGVNGCAWSPDNGRLASAGADGTVKIWNAATGECEQTLAGHSGGVNDCAWSPDNGRLVSAGVDGTVKIWNAATGECEQTLIGHSGEVNGCAWSPDNARLVSTGGDGTVKIWNTTTGECVQTLAGHTGMVFGCAWSLDNSRLVSAGFDGTVKIWNATKGECEQTLVGHAGLVSDCAWSPDNGRLVSSGADGTVKIWNAETGECVQTLAGHTGMVFGCAWSPDNGRLVSSGADGAVKIWNALTGECEQTLGGHTGRVSGCAWSPDHSRVVSAGDGTVKIWNALTGECEQTLSGHTGRVNGCAWSPDRSRVVSAGDGAVRIWNALTGECEQTLVGHTGMVFGCAWSPDNGWVVSAGDDGTVRIWNAATGECMQTLAGHFGWVDSCAWSPDNSRLVSSGSDGTVRVWNAVTGECVQTMAGHSGVVIDCAWSPDNGRLVSSGSDGTVRVWNALTGECMQTMAGHFDVVNNCAWSPDNGRVVSAGDDGTVRIWNALTGECMQTLVGHSYWVLGCAWSPDNNQVVSASADGTVKIWNTQSGECEQTLTGHSGWANGCAWSPDNSRVVSAGSDGTVKIWDAVTGKCLVTLYQGSGEPGLEDWASIDEVNNRVLARGRDGWRHLAWQAPDADGRLTTYPLEWLDGVEVPAAESRSASNNG